MRNKLIFALSLAAIPCSLLSHAQEVNQVGDYPSEAFSASEIRSGAFVLYLAGIFYMFIGIALVTQNFIHPSIDIIKQKGVLSFDSMNATLLAMTNSAAESFIIINAFMFGATDMGISTILGEIAFSALVIQAVFYLVAEVSTRVDWWISTRDTIFMMLQLFILIALLIGNSINLWRAVVMLVMYFIHVLLMKYNHLYEVAIKKSVARNIELKKLK